MGIMDFKTKFSNISNQFGIRLDSKYRYFSDMKQFKVWEINDENTYCIKNVLTYIPPNTVSPDNYNEKYPLVELKNIERRFNKLIDTEEIEQINSDKVILEQGDIFFPKLEPQKGQFKLNLSHDKYIGSTELIEFRINKKLVEPLFLYYMFTHRDFLYCLRALESGKTHKRVNYKDFLNIVIPEIDIQVQRKILSEIIPITNEIDKLKAKLRNNYDIVNDVFNKSFKFDYSDATNKMKSLTHLANFSDFSNEEMKFDISLKYRCIFEQNIKNKSDNKWISLGKIVKIKGGKRLPKGEDVIDDETEYKYIRVEDLRHDGYFDIENVKFITEENHNKIKNYIANTGNILITIVGATVGKCGIVPLELDNYNISENFARIIVNKDSGFLNEYINYCLMAYFSKIQIEEYKGRGSQGKLALFRIKKIQIPNISLTVQKAIIDDIKIQFEKQKSIENQILDLRNNIDTLLSRVIK